MPEIPRSVVVRSPPDGRDSALADLLYVFVPPITVDVSADRFLWMRRNAVLDLRTSVYLDLTGDIILGVGDPPSVEGYSEVRLFPEQPDGNEPLRPRLLERYCTHAIQTLMASRFFIKPRILVKGIERLNESTAGYARDALAAALIRAGAARVVMQE
jgi:hypothetical protein